MTPTIGLISLTSVEVDAHVHALKHSQHEMEKAGIKVSDVCLVTHQRPWDSNGIRLIQLPFAIDILSYARMQVRRLHEWIETDFILNIQADGFVTNASKWTDDFLKYDYIGAPWAEPKGLSQARVGNSGFSLRSRKFCELSGVKYEMIDWEEDPFVFYDDQGDDVYWTQVNDWWFKSKECRFGSMEIATQFSIEQKIPECPDRTIQDCFGQHANGRITRK